MSTPERPTVPGDEREQRWTLRVTPARHPEAGVVLPLLMAYGPNLEDEYIEVVPASRLAEAEANADGFRRAADAYLASLERAREALEKIARLPSIRKTERAGAHELVSIRVANALAQAALDALVALPVVERTEDR